MNIQEFIIYLIIMASITYLLRALPFTLINKKIENKYINSFLYYLPYTVLSCMTFPAIIYATSSKIAALVGMLVAILLAIRGKSLLFVAGISCLVVFLCELLLI